MECVLEKYEHLSERKKNNTTATSAKLKNSPNHHTNILNLKYIMCNESNNRLNANVSSHDIDVSKQETIRSVISSPAKTIY